MKKRFLNQPLIVQIVFVFFIGILFASIINTCIGYSRNMKLCIDNMENENRSLVHYTVKNLEENCNLPWLLSYSAYS